MHSLFLKAALVFFGGDRPTCTVGVHAPVIGVDVNKGITEELDGRSVWHDLGVMVHWSTFQLFEWSALREGGDFFLAHFKIHALFSARTPWGNYQVESVFHKAWSWQVKVLSLGWYFSFGNSWRETLSMCVEVQPTAMQNFPVLPLSARFDDFSFGMLKY